MTLFPNIPVIIKRYALSTSTVPAGHYQRGKWVEGAQSGSDITILASVQPASGNDMRTFAEGRRVSAMYKCFTDTEVFTSDPVKGKNRDTATWNGQVFEIVHVEPWTNGIISHFMFLMMRENEIPNPQPPVGV